MAAIKSFFAKLGIGSIAAIPVYLGMFLILGGSHVVSYAPCPPYIASFGCGLNTLVSGIELEIAGAALIGLGLYPLTNALLNTEGTNPVAASGYLLTLTCLVSMIFIATMTTVFARPIGHIGDGLPVGYLLAIPGVGVGIGLLYKGRGKDRRVSAERRSRTPSTQ